MPLVSERHIGSAEPASAEPASAEPASAEPAWPRLIQPINLCMTITPHPGSVIPRRTILQQRGTIIAEAPRWQLKPGDNSPISRSRGAIGHGTSGLAFCLRRDIGIRIQLTCSWLAATQIRGSSPWSCENALHGQDPDRLGMGSWNLGHDAQCVSY